MCRLVNARHTLQLKKGRNTHVLCAAAVGSKYQQARNWGIATVSREWLVQSILEGRLLAPESFPVPEAAASTATPCNLEAITEFIQKPRASQRTKKPCFNTRDALAALASPQSKLGNGRSATQQTPTPIDDEGNSREHPPPPVTSIVVEDSGDPAYPGILRGVFVMISMSSNIPEKQRANLRAMATRLGATVITHGGSSDLRKCTHYIFKGKANDTLKE